MEEFLRQLLGVLDITGGFNWRLALGLTVVTFLGELLIQVPLLLESVWMIIGYQVGNHTTVTSVSSVTFLFLFAQLGRQVMTLAVYFFFPVLNFPISRLYTRLIKPNRYFQWVVRRLGQYRYLNENSFLSVGSSTIAMFTPLAVPVKLLLTIRRKLKTLLLATFFSTAIFDAVYLTLGAVFHTTRLNLTFLPLFILGVFLVFNLIRMRLIAKR